MTSEFYDVVILGAGIGGLTAAARLVKNKHSVLILEKIHHIGGTSHVFKRNNFIFPMGPLSFSYPELIRNILEEIGIDEEISFSRSHFQITTPNINIVYSKSLNELQADLIQKFPEEKEGIQFFISTILDIIDKVKNIQDWHPDYMIQQEKRRIARKKLETENKEKFKLVERYSKISSKEFLDKIFTNDDLKRLLGSQGTYEPVMSMLHLAFMWNVMSEEGIWFPSQGIHGLNRLIYNFIIQNGGKVLLNTPVQKINIENNLVKSVLTKNGKEYCAKHFISNIDYKKVFLQLIDQESIPKEFYKMIKDNKYTGSEFCVYLGIDDDKLNLSNIEADHIFYRKNLANSENIKPDQFENKEIEICIWSNKSEKFVPKNMKSILLRVNLNYDFFKKWRIAEKQRKSGYKTFKENLATKLINIVEDIIPQLSDKIDTIEIATPLTYKDWGQRYRGSIAGWSRDLERVSGIHQKLLILTPIKNLLMVGAYSSTELFLGGYPLSMFSGKLAADYISHL